MRKKVKRVNRRNRYPEELKRKIAKSYLAGEASYGVLAEENGLKNKGVVKEFVKWYRKKLGNEEETTLIMSLENQPAPSSTEAALKRKLELLEKQLALSSLKIEGLETLIDLAEEELEISIRKKSGSKQSKK
ncbi:MAG: hypothetical protein AAF443_08475 [Chlamydiota bacterium]